MFYQLGLRQFGSLVRITLRPPPPLRDLLRLAVDHADGVGATSLPPDEIVEVSSAESETNRSMQTDRVELLFQRLSAKLIDSREMLDEYFSFRISDMGDIESIPLLLPGYLPDLDKLPLRKHRSPLATTLSYTS